MHWLGQKRHGCIQDFRVAPLVFRQLKFRSKQTENHWIHTPIRVWKKRHQRLEECTYVCTREIDCRVYIVVVAASTRTWEEIGAPVLVGVHHGFLTRDLVWSWRHLLQDLSTDNGATKSTLYCMSTRHKFYETAGVQVILNLYTPVPKSSGFDGLREPKWQSYANHNKCSRIPYWHKANEGNLYTCICAQEVFYTQLTYINYQDKSACMLKISLIVRIR